MVCQKCNNEGVYVKGLNYQFFYCRTCKTEIELEVTKHKRKKEPLLDPENEIDWDPYIYYNGEG